MKLCFTTTLIAHPDYMKDTVGEFIPFNTKEYDFILFTNLPGYTHPSWKVIYINDETLNKYAKIDSSKTNQDMKQIMRNNVFKSRYIKFMGWKYIKEILKKDYDVIFYCDAIYSPSTIKNWEELAIKIKNNESGLLQKLHPMRTDPYKECFNCVRCGKESKENMDKMVNYLRKVGAKEKKQIYENTSFGYDPNNKKITDAYTEFWDIYTENKFTYRDQPLWGWICQKRSIKAIHEGHIHTNVIHKRAPFDSPFYFIWTGVHFNRSRSYKHLM